MACYWQARQWQLEPATLMYSNMAKWRKENKASGQGETCFCSHYEYV
jgi:hypothetical protein